MPAESFADFRPILIEELLRTEMEICALNWMVQNASFYVMVER